MPICQTHKGNHSYGQKSTQISIYPKYFLSDETSITLDGPDGWLYINEVIEAIQSSIMIWSNIIGGILVGSQSFWYNQNDSWSLHCFSWWALQALVQKLLYLRKKSYYTFKQNNAPSHSPSNKSNYLHQLDFSGPYL